MIHLLNGNILFSNHAFMWIHEIVYDIVIHTYFGGYNVTSKIIIKEMLLEEIVIWIKYFLFLICDLVVYIRVILLDLVERQNRKTISSRMYVRYDNQINFKRWLNTQRYAQQFYSRFILGSNVYRK